ncbi:uncharacterized protein Dwil_GK17523 [Drosophila willistoni]|uniref:DUF4777 domain-containing protein n=1 Tax=Drosophila willistoni TaxID=7260 RepID=B4NP93_DROWI|nr:uncharacterized protein LOC6652948 [Drosophila willistoni]EDW86333.1 uncharacterized protein Dwil_GK17523 [Drosophila willistoni]
MPVSYNPRALPRQRRLVPNLFRNILLVLRESQRPMSDAEIVSALAVNYRRIDPEFQRQVRINLRDGVAYGILRRQLDVYSVRAKQLAMLTSWLAPKRKN